MMTDFVHHIALLPGQAMRFVVKNNRFTRFFVNQCSRPVIITVSIVGKSTSMNGFYWNT